MPGHHSVENFAQAIRAIGEPIHNRTAEEISMAKLLTLLLEVTGLFDMRTRPELILLQKTMVVVEGVARGFDPKLDIWKVADPWCANGSSVISDRSDASRARCPAPANSGGIFRPAGARDPRRSRDRAIGDHDPGGSDIVAGDHRGDGADRGPQEPLAHLGAVDHRGDLYRDSGGRSAVMIALLSEYDSIDITPRRGMIMASLTIRKLDDAIRDELRLRAARNGRSVEDEVRVILRDASQKSPMVPSPAPRATAGRAKPSQAHSIATGQPRVTLIIGGGIAAYKALDLIRRLKSGTSTSVAC